MNWKFWKAAPSLCGNGKSHTFGRWDFVKDACVTDGVNTHILQHRFCSVCGYCQIDKQGK